MMISEHIFFIRERITDILELERKKEVDISEIVKKSIEKLNTELLTNYNYLTQLEKKKDEKVVWSEHEHQYYRNLSTIADSSDIILDLVINHGVGNIAKDISNVIEHLHKSYNSLSSEPIYIFNTGGNTNLPGGIQKNGSTNIYFNDGEPSRMIQEPRPESFGHYPNRVFVGFNHEIKTLLDHLLQPHDVIGFVGIVGMGGSGKTTLAKHIFHHPEIKTHFHLRVWVCISQSRDTTSILNSIWREATQDPKAERMDYRQVVRQLYNYFLSSKSFLIILDDIWSIDAWKHIHQAFPENGRNKVVVTTRKRNVARGFSPTIPIVEPKQLDERESYELFRKTATLIDKNPPHDLLSLEVEMVEKCKGLPLAIITLAGVLQMNISRSSWERINVRLESHILTTKDASKAGVVKEVLALSYDELPHHIKPCSLYLHIFPEDEVIDAQKLIQMWVAECFVDEESKAEGYLDELAQRSIVEVVKTDYEGKVCELRIHDLIRETFVNIDKERRFLKKKVLRLVPRTTL